jgi:hypothetical protein
MKKKQPVAKDDSLLNKIQKIRVEEEYNAAKKIFELQTELRTDKRFKDYFDQFNDTSVEQFIEAYAFQKYLWTRHSSFYTQANEADAFFWQTKAEQHFEYILQKKLFDMQCLWRAGEIEIPQVDIGFDFQWWATDVLRCPFVSPVTQHELDLYIEYLQQGDAQQYWGSNKDWQDYDRIKNSYNTASELTDIPAWYRFHNLKTGASKLLMLADQRGEMEKNLMQLAAMDKEMADRKKETKALPITKPPIPKLWDSTFEAWFVKAYEDTNIQRCYEESNTHSEKLKHKIEIEALVKALLNSDEPVAIEANEDWRVALTEASNRHSCKMIVRHLPEVYANYQMKLGLGIVAEQDDTMEEDRAFRNMLKQQIDHGMHIYSQKQREL